MIAYREALRYAAVSLVSFVTSAVVTHYAETGASHLTDDRGWRVALIAAAYLATSAVFFALKFVLYERLVFTGPRREPAPRPAPDQPAATGPIRSASSGGRSNAAPTTSSPPPAQSGTRK